jgi:general secretion pathway protein A
MYLEFYNLSAEPFRITPDPEFLYLSPSHREALATITYAVEQGKGFMVLVGEVGLGKTTLLQTFLQERAGVKEKLIYLFNSRFSYAGLLRALAWELDLKAASVDPGVLLNSIYQALIREYAQGNRVVLLIDEAQGLSEETLEGFRLISNLETPTDKLLQIVLVGQPELTAKLNRYELRQLKQRIAVQAVLSPLTRKESREYLRFRLEKAGGRMPDIFTPRALEKIVRRAKGIPRALNILADNALVTGFGYGRKPVTVKVVREVIGPAAPAASPKRKVEVSPAPEIQPAVAKERPASGFPVTRKVRAGENLYRMILEVYGASNPELWDLVRKRNPRIKEDLEIRVGEKFIFPDWKRMAKNGE